MNLERLLDQIRLRLTDSNTPHDSEWAYDLCALSRRIHVAVWETRPDIAWVQEHVLPALRTTERAARDALRTGDYAHLLNDFADNVAARKINISKNYLRGRPSAFPPDSRLQDVPDEKITEELAAG